MKPVESTMEWDHSWKGELGSSLSPMEFYAAAPFAVIQENSGHGEEVWDSIPTWRKRAALNLLSDAEILKSFKFSIQCNEITYATSWVVCCSILVILACLIVSRVRRRRALVPFKICWIRETFGATDFPSCRVKIHFSVRNSTLPIHGQQWSYCKCLVTYLTQHHGHQALIQETCEL